MRTFFIRLRSNWMRNLLAILQVAVAIAAVTGVFASVLPALRLGDEGLEPNALRLRFGVRRENSAAFTHIFHADDAQYLQDEADTLEAASVQQMGVSVSIIKVGDERYAVPGIGKVSPTYDKVVGLDMVEGSFFTASEVSGSAARVVVISERLAEMLYGDQSPVGRIINLRPDEEGRLISGSGVPTSNRQTLEAMPGTDLEIIGVFRMPEVRIGAVTTHLFMPAPNERESIVMVAPPPTVSSSGTVERAAPVPTPRTIQEIYGEIIVKPRDGMAREAQEEVLSLMRTRISGRPQANRVADGVPYDILVEEVRDLDAAMRRANLQGSLMTGAMGLVALIVAGFAIFTTTLANISQRTRTIGLARSIGATRGYVIRDVVFEATLLAGLGGVIGALSALPLGKHVLTPIRVTIGEAGATVLDVVLAGGAGVILAMAIGALAALYPAWTVARLMPSEAWREGRV